MKILIKECKKIMDIRVLLVIAVFTVLFYQLFLEVTIYPAGGQTTNSPYDMPFYAELIESWGTSLPREDWSKLDEKRKELEEAYTRIIAADPVLADAKITNYQEFSKTREIFFDKDTLTDEEKKIDQELSRLVFEDSKGSKLFFEFQVLDRLDEYKNLQNGDSISLMPGGIFYIVEKDMRMMGILLLICFAILALPYLIRERLCHVLPLYATTATGRKLFDRQFQALVACCGFVGIVQFGIYVLVYVIKGLAVFWKGDCIDDTGLQLWCKNLPFGFYMLLYMLLVFVFVLAAVVLIYLIGRQLHCGNCICHSGMRRNWLFADTHFCTSVSEANGRKWAALFGSALDSGVDFGMRVRAVAENAQGSLQRSLTIDDGKKVFAVT